MGNGLFSGRNGSDALSVFLTAAALVLAVAASVITTEVARYIVSAIAIVLVVIAAVRMLSTNIAKRRAENEKFLAFFRKFKKDPQKKAEKARRKEDKKLTAHDAGKLLGFTPPTVIRMLAPQKGVFTACTPLFSLRASLPRSP